MNADLEMSGSFPEETCTGYGARLRIVVCLMDESKEDTSVCLFAP